jgi:hypothetical protein
MRGIARWGTGDMLDAAFTGFAALPPPSGWREILSVGRKDTPKVELEVAKQNHPDAGGSQERMSELNSAIPSARKELSA